MANQKVVLDLPENIYERVKQRADNKNRTVEAELIEVVTTAVPVEDELPQDMLEAVAELRKLNDKALWKAARSHTSAKTVSKMEKMHFKQQNESLSELEKQSLAQMLYEYEKTILIRAEAAGLLMERGYDITGKILK
jgi:plasmid stability protein